MPVGGILDRGEWDSGALIYWTEAQVDAIFAPLVGERKVRTREELRAAVEASHLRHPAIKVWIAEGLEEAARQIWQESSQAVNKGSFG